MSYNDRFILLSMETSLDTIDTISMQSSLYRRLCLEELLKKIKWSSPCLARVWLTGPSSMMGGWLARGLFTL
jgi:hypothetical protein